MPIQQFSKLEFCEDFGDGPLLLAHVTTDRSAIAVVSLLGGFVAMAALGFPGAAFVAFAALNDFSYAGKVEADRIGGDDEPIAIGGDDEPIDVTAETVVTTEVEPIAVEPSDHSADAGNMVAAQPIAKTTAAPPSSTSVKPGDSIGLDLAAVLLAMPEFCHILLAGENGTGKTTFAMALLKPIINKFIQITGFELLLIDPKRSRWNGLFQTKSYQSAFSNQPHDLERSVNRLELIYFKLDKLSSDRQKAGKRTEVPTLVIIDEVNTWLDALKAFDRNFKEENASLPAAERSPAPRLYNRAVDSIAGISRMGREDRVWLWLIGQNSNLEALGLSGAQDRANFSIVAVGLGDNQITIELALSNSTMFTRGQALKNALKDHQGKPYQIAACTRKPANLLIMPSSYKDNAQEDFSAEILARLGGTSSTTIALPSPSSENTSQAIVETVAIDDRPNGLDEYQLVSTIWDYLGGKEPRTIKQISDAMRNSGKIPDEILQAKIPNYSNYKDGIRSVLSFGISNGFLVQIGDSYQAVKPS